MIEKVPVGPTRYRDVVLTSWDRGMSVKERPTIRRCALLAQESLKLRLAYRIARKHRLQV